MYDRLARYYDLVHVSLTADRDHILGLAEITGGPVLELGCGTGRITIPLARAGYHVTGVDNSAAMLVRAHRRLQEELHDTQERVELVEADIRDLSFWDKRRLYALVLLPYNMLLHFRAKEVPLLLRKVAEHLQKNGLVFIDVTNPFAIDQWSSDRELVLENVLFDSEAGQAVRQFSRSWLDSGAQRLHTEWIFEVEAVSDSGWDQSKIAFDYWYHFPHQLELFLEQAGLVLDTVAGDYDGSRFDEDSERLLMTARRTKSISR